MTTSAGPATPEWDFFVSYTSADRNWAEWISWQLEAAGYRVLVQAWDFVPGSNWVSGMHEGIRRGGHLIAILSPAYIDSVFGTAEWQAFWASDPTGAKRLVIPFRVADCVRPGLLSNIVTVDLFDVAERDAAIRLQEAVFAAIEGRVSHKLTPVPRDGSRGERDRCPRATAISPISIQ